MSAKNRDEHNRRRNITVGFRVSPEENEQINAAVALSGLPKQESHYLALGVHYRPSDSIPKLGRYLGERNGSQLQYCQVCCGPWGHKVGQD